MTLTPSDMLAIQSAIDAYENKFPHRPSPSAEEALAWRSGNSWTRLLLWWHADVVSRVRSISIPKKVTIKYKASKARTVRNLPAPPLSNVP
jgi:hypothetical protein